MFESYGLYEGGPSMDLGTLGDCHKIRSAARDVRGDTSKEQLAPRDIYKIIIQTSEASGINKVAQMW